MKIAGPNSHLSLPNNPSPWLARAGVAAGAAALAAAPALAQADSFFVSTFSVFQTAQIVNAEAATAFATQTSLGAGPLLVIGAAGLGLVGCAAYVAYLAMHDRKGCNPVNSSR